MACARVALRGRDALTAGEYRVSQMAAAGQTNRQIAQALFLTEKTIENHLTHAYAKLGVVSRRELAGAVAEARLAAPQTNVTTSERTKPQFSSLAGAARTPRTTSCTHGRARRMRN